MSEAPTYAIQTFRASDDLTDAMVALFGNSIEDAWDMAVPEPAVIGAMTPEGEMAGGIFMLFDGAGGSKVASIRQLIVKPEHWGRSIAGRLLRRSMELAEETKCSRIRSTAGWGCPDHRVMYDRLKFERAKGSDSPYLVTLDLKKK